MKKSVCTVILNRNLPIITDKLFSNLKKKNKISDFFVLEAGSQKKLLSKNYTWHANTKTIKKNGLRFARGINYSICQLIKEGKFDHYDAYFFLTNDTTFSNYAIIKKLYQKLFSLKKLAILSPCSKDWGEYKILKKQKTKFFWHIVNNALMIKKDFIKEMMPTNYNYLNALFDGSNFRGYGLETELISKAYSNNWSAGITSSVLAGENESYLINSAEKIKTETYDKNLELYIKEGKKWMKNKYGFSSKWAMQIYSKNFYDKFFENNPEYNKYKI